MRPTDREQAREGDGGHRLPRPPFQPARTPLAKLRLLAEIAAFVSIVVADAWGFVPLTQTILLLPLVWLMIRLRGERLSAIGFTRPRSGTGRAVALGLAAGIALELLAGLVTTPLISGLAGAEPDHAGLVAIRGDAARLAIFLALSWTLGAFGEEICFRGFLLDRVERLLGGGRAATIASLVLGSVLFGWGHTEQGIAGWVQEALSGLLLGILFLRAGRNLVVPIAAHGASNSLAFVLIYLGSYPGIG